MLKIIIRFIKIFIFCLSIPSIALADKSVLFDGVLGPIKVETTGVKNEFLGRIKRDVRKETKKFFSGKPGVLYRVSISAQLTSRQTSDRQASLIETSTKTWEVLVEFEKIRPLYIHEGGASFILKTSTSGIDGVDDPSKHLSEFLSKRINLEIHEAAGLDMSNEIAKLNRNMQKSRGVSIIEKAFVVSANVVVAGVEVSKDLGSGLASTLTDVSTASAINSSISGLSTSNRSADQIITDSYKAVERQSRVIAEKQQINQAAHNKLHASENYQTQTRSNKSSSIHHSNASIAKNNIKTVEQKDQSMNTATNRPSSSHSPPVVNTAIKEEIRETGSYGGLFPIEWGNNDIEKYGGVFMVETGSEERAKSDVENHLKRKAKAICEASDWRSVELQNWKAHSCNSINRLGTVFWHCQASGIYQCFTK